MVASVNGSGSTWSDAALSRLDTKKQGHIEQSDLASALSATGESGASDDTAALKEVFSATDGDSDGRVTRSELSDAMTKLSDQLNAQFDASRVQGGMAPGAPPAEALASSSAASASSGEGGVDAAGGTQGAGGPRGGGGAGGAAPAGGSTGSTDSTTSTDYVAAADTDGNGTVSDAEQAVYDKKLASGEIDKNGKEIKREDGGRDAKDPVRELARAIDQLKAYADEDRSAASTAGVSVDA
jgi:hypothetical protein